MKPTRGPRSIVAEFASNLWELLQGPSEPPRLGPPGSSKSGSKARSARKPRRSRGSIPPAAPTPPARGRGSRQQNRYDELVKSMKAEFGLRVVRWRSSTSGCAWQVFYKDGSVARLIESPYPRGPMSCAVFLHEVGHHAIGFKTYRPRCREEYHAWRWSFEKMLELDFNLTEAVRRRRDEALHYAVAKAARRGLKRLPVELVPFVEPRSRDLEPLPALLEPPHNPVLAAAMKAERESSGSGGGSTEDGLGIVVESSGPAVGLERGG